jgi:uncharacterized protein
VLSLKGRRPGPGGDHCRALRPDVRERDVYAEYEEVIRRPRFKRTESEIEDTLRAIRELGIWVKPSQKVRACADPDDDVFLECAQAARAHHLVTGNVKHFPAQWADTRMVTPQQFLEAIAEIQEEPPQP